MAQKWLPASSLTGGGEGALDAIDGSNVSDGDRAIVISDLVYFYVLDAASGIIESPPNVISPDTNPGNKRWILVDVRGLVMVESGSFLLGGTDNEKSGTTNTCIIGGVGNEARHTINSCGMLGGFQNKILFNTDLNAVAGGENNLVGFASSKVMMAGGQNNFAKAAQSALLSGEQNVAMSISDALGMKVSGVGAFACLPGQKAHANGFFGVAGDAQVSELVMKRETLDGIAAFIPLSADFGLIPLMTPKTWKYTIDVVARQVGGTAGTVGESAMWRITGGVKNVGAQLSQGTVSFSGAAADGDTVVISGLNTYTFRNTPSTAMDLQAGDAATAAASLAKIVKARDQYILDAEVSGTAVILTVHPEMSGGAMSLGLACSGVNISCDGGGTFGGTTAWAEGFLTAVGTPQGTGTPESHAADGGTAAQGTITIGGAGTTTEGETFEVAGQTFTWTATPSGQFDISLAASVSECGGKIELAVNNGMTTVTAEQTMPDTVVITAVAAGAAGNSLTFISNTANVSMDGLGTLGGTTGGADAASPWEVNIEVDDFNMGLKINVTGEAGKIIHWVAKVELVEVG